MTPESEAHKVFLAEIGGNDMSMPNSARHHEKRYNQAVARLSNTTNPSERKELALCALEHFTHALRSGNAHGEVLRIASDFLWEQQKAFAKMLGVTLDGAPDSKAYAANAISTFMIRITEGDTIESAEIQAYDAYWKFNPKGQGVIENGKWLARKDGTPRTHAQDLHIFMAEGDDEKGGVSLAEAGMRTIKNLLRKHRCYPGQE